MSLSLTEFIEQHPSVYFSRQACGAPFKLNFSQPWVIFIVNKDYPALSACLWNKVLATDNSAFLIIEDKKLMPALLSILVQEKNLRGGGFGVGFKDWVVQQGLIEVDEYTRTLGAANVFRQEDKELVGINTDGEGFVAPLLSLAQERKIDWQSKQVVLLGAGGTARAIAFALVKRNIKVVIVNRTVAKAQTLQQDLLRYFGTSHQSLVQLEERSKLGLVLKQNNLLAIVNTVDSHQVEVSAFSPLADLDLTETDNQQQSLELLKQAKLHNPRLIIADILLRHEPTKILHQARSLELLTIDGRPMVFNQAVPAIKFVFPELKKSDQQILTAIQSVKF